MAVPNEWLNEVEPLAAHTLHDGADASAIAAISAAISLKRLADRLCDGALNVYTRQDT